MYKKISLYIALGLFLASQNMFANAGFQYEKTPYSSNLQGYVLYVPSGTKISAVLSQEVNSNTATVGQNISAILTEDFTYNEQLIASSGSVISGSVVSNIKSGIGGKNAQMQIRFTTIRTPYNNVIPISAVIATNDLTGILNGGTLKEKSAHADANTTYKTSIAGGLGIAKAVAAKGEDIKIASNSQINIIFEQPITLGAQ